MSQRNKNEPGDDSQIKELRTALFCQLQRLSDPSADLDKEIRRATAITSVGNVIVNSVKVEVDFLRVNNQAKANGLHKLPQGDNASKQLAAGE